MNTREAKRVLEAALVCSREPLQASELAALFAGEVTLDEVRELLDEIGRDCGERGVELKALASGFSFQSRPELAPYLARLHPERPPRFSRAVMETLAIIAFRQPVTRGDIEDIRGVQVASGIVKQLEDRGWVEAIGYRESPGRPALLATTKAFLDDLGLQSLDQLPALDGVDGLSASLVPTAAEGAQPSQAALALEAVLDGAPGAAAATGGSDTGDAAGGTVEAAPDDRREIDPSATADGDVDASPDGAADAPSAASDDAVPPSADAGADAPSAASDDAVPPSADAGADAPSAASDDAVPPSADAAADAPPAASDDAVPPSAASSADAAAVAPEAPEPPAASTGDSLTPEPPASDSEPDEGQPR